MKRVFGIGKKGKGGRVDEDRVVDILKEILTLVRAI